MTDKQKNPPKVVVPKGLELIEKIEEIIDKRFGYFDYQHKVYEFDEDQEIVGSQFLIFDSDLKKLKEDLKEELKSLIKELKKRLDKDG